MSDVLNWFKYNFWWLLIVFVLLLCAYLIFRLQKKPVRVISKPIEDELIDEFIDCYGGMKNINHADIDGRRLKVNLVNVKAVDIERFKMLGATGIFISGDNIKMVLPYDMNKLVQKINEI
jgi:phosphotransferase system IIB component